MGKGLKATVAGLVAAFALAAVPSQAAAVDALSIYHPDENARSFVTSDGGFTGSDSATGLCIPVLLCPSVSNSWVPTGGTGGTADGHLRTSISDLLGVAGQTNAVWTGPDFIYAGAGNQTPTAVVLTIARRVDLGALLSVVGNEANYSVELVNETAGGVATRLIDKTNLSPTAGWTRSALVAVNPADLVIGHSYRFRIISQFTYGAAVIQGGGVDYDDLILVAARQEPPPPVPGPPGPPGPTGPTGPGGGGNGGGGGGGGGTGGGGGGGGTGGNQAVFDGRNLFIKLKCFGVKNENGKCHTRATALKKKGGTRYTFPIQRVVKAKKGKVIRARVRFRFRKKLEKQKSIVLKSVLSEDRKRTDKVTKFKKLKLIDKS